MATPRGASSTARSSPRCVTAFAVIMPRSVARPLDPAAFETYQGAQPSPETRRGVAEFPRQIRRARPMLSRLADEAPRALRGKPMELVWAMKDPAFGREKVIQRWLRDFPEAHVTRLSDANHHVQEDAPEALAAAVERVAIGPLSRGPS